MQIMVPEDITLFRIRSYGNWWLYIYPFLVVFGYVSSAIIPNQELDRERKEWYWISGRNIINHTFAYEGRYFFDGCFLALFILQFYVKASYDESLLPTNNNNNSQKNWREWSKKTIRVYLLKFLIVYVTLFACFLFIDHVFIWTGGSCDISDTKSAQKCKSLGGVWSGGFDISGHFCFLTNISLILWQELKLLFNSSNQYSVYWTTFPRVVHWLILSILLIWINILSITAIYYHTFLEKVLGCLLGYSCLVLIYYTIPKVKTLNKILM